jgi:integrase
MSEGSDMAQLERTATPGIYKRAGARGTRYVHVWRHRGTQHRKSFRTLEEARDHKAQTRAGSSKPIARVWFEDYATDWIRSYRGRTSRGFAETTRTEYRRAIEEHAIPGFKRYRLDEIDPQDVRDFFARLERQGLTLAGIRKVRAPLSALFATALEDGKVRSNPVQGIRIVTSQVQDAADPRKALTREELSTLLAAVPDEHRLLFELMAHTGMRIGETIGLRWQDVELGEAPCLRVRSQVYRGKRRQLKSGYARRAIPLSTGMARRLWSLRGAATFRGDEDPVFASRVGTPLSPSNLNGRVLKDARESVGLDWVSFHTFRHTCASLLFEAGKNVKQVQEWLGHHDPGFTLRTYVHLMDEGLGDADFLDQAVKTKASPADADAPRIPVAV